MKFLTSLQYFPTEKPCSNDSNETIFNRWFASMDKIEDSHQYEFIWEKAKDESNVTKHGVSFAQVTHVFHDPMALTIFDKSHSMFEERWLTLGMMDNCRLIVASHTYTELSENRTLIRLISARFATRKERLYYETQPQNGDRYVH